MFALADARNAAPSRTVFSDADAGMPVIESVQIAPLPLAPSGDPTEYPFMRSVRSAIEAVAPYLGIGELSNRKTPVQREIPVDLLDVTSAPVYSESVAKKVQPQNSQIGNTSPEGYGMTYDLRVQSFKSFSDQLEDESKSKANVNEPKDQQGEILDDLEQLLMGQWTLLTQQQGMQSMVEREFVNQESYMSEIKHLLNLLRKTGEPKDKVAGGTAHSDSTTSSTEVTETSTTISPMPETTSTVPTKAAKSTS
jgi:hypothetical protein